jgi:Mn2+/Fe2+ NRAMP family transporter
VNPSDPSAFSKIALSLAPLAGKYATLLFAIGLMNASLMAASVLPLTTTYAITEAFGLERGINKSFREAPAFLTIYTSLIVLGAATAMFPGAPLALITNLPNILNGVLLPLLLPLLILLANDRRILGRYANGPFTNVLSGAVFIFLTGVTVVFLASILFPGRFGT